MLIKIKKTNIRFKYSTPTLVCNQQSCFSDVNWMLILWIKATRPESTELFCPPQQGTDRRSEFSQESLSTLDITHHLPLLKLLLEFHLLLCCVMLRNPLLAFLTANQSLSSAPASCLFALSGVWPLTGSATPWGSCTPVHKNHWSYHACAPGVGSAVHTANGNRVMSGEQGGCRSPVRVPQACVV